MNKQLHIGITNKLKAEIKQIQNRLNETENLEKTAEIRKERRYLKDTLNLKMSRLIRELEYVTRK